MRRENFRLTFCFVETANRAGIEGVYDYTVETGGWGFNGQPPADPTAGPSIFTAIQENLGLRLAAQKAPIDVLIVDSALRIPIEH